jgi:plastocyanin
MKLRNVLLLGAALPILAACNSSEPSGDVSTGPARGDAVKVTAVDNAFEPSEIALEAGTDVTIEVTNSGDSTHDFAIDDVDLNTGTIGAGDVATATFTVPEGTTEFHCTFHGGMSGQIVAE